MPFLNPKTREKIPTILLQIAVLLFLVLIFRECVLNAQNNIDRLGMNAGFAFLNTEAGFEISQKIIPFDAGSTYLRAIIIGILNTLVLAVVSIILCTIIGIIVAFARFSHNPVLTFVATLYVETFRNIPLLLQIFFWYFGVISAFPTIKQSLSLGPIFLNNRGLFLPVMNLTPWGWFVIGVDITAIILVIFFVWKSYSLHGRIARKNSIIITLCIVVPFLCHLFGSRIGEWNMPVLAGFSFRGGINVRPEFVAMLAGLSIYNSTFMSEIFRSGILSVPKGQFEAAETVGLTGAKAYLLVILPQALRVAIPPAGGQFQNLIKASSLSVAIAYPDIMGLVSGTILIQTSQAIECMIIVIVLYLVINLTVTLMLNIYNSLIMRRGGT
ncbi:MAG: ABC transporter permease subunit [Deltaproteobacteria bacterium]|nr:ABC transporter permease subunit [Deltaproteobacteria bacterium]